MAQQWSRWKLVLCSSVNMWSHILVMPSVKVQLHTQVTVCLIPFRCHCTYCTCSTEKEGGKELHLKPLMILWLIEWPPDFELLIHFGRGTNNQERTWPLPLRWLWEDGLVALLGERGKECVCVRVCVCKETESCSLSLWVHAPSRTQCSFSPL